MTQRMHEVDRVIAERVSEALGIPVSTVPIEVEELARFFVDWILGESVSVWYCPAEEIEAKTERVKKLSGIIDDLVATLIQRDEDEI